MPWFFKKLELLLVLLPLLAGAAYAGSTNVTKKGGPVPIKILVQPKKETLEDDVDKDLTPVNSYEKLFDEKSIARPPSPKVRTIHFRRTRFSPEYMRFKKFLKGRSDEYNKHNNADSRILLLGDKESEYNYSKASVLAPRLPRAQIFKTDIRVKKEEEGVFGNLVVKQVDHTGALPFPDGHFDIVVMNNGICHCNDEDSTCGGLDINTQDVTRFMAEVYRVMKKNNTSSQAILHGYNPARDKMVKVLEESGKELMRLHPDIQVDMLSSTGLFGRRPTVLGVRIAPKEVAASLEDVADGVEEQEVTAPENRSFWKRLWCKFRRSK